MQNQYLIFFKLFFYKFEKKNKLEDKMAQINIFSASF